MWLAPKENFRCPFKYQGQYYDSEVELCYNRFRYYHPETGRYISEDPIGFLSGEPNFFAYVGDSNVRLDVLALNSTILNRALGGTPYDNMQAHHLIPVEVWKDNVTFLNTIGLSGQRDTASNGILLYDSEIEARKNNKAFYHNGSHSNYSKIVDTRIKKIQKKYDADIKDIMRNHNGDIEKITKATQEARKRVENLQNRLRKILDKEARGNYRRLS